MEQKFLITDGRLQVSCRFSAPAHGRIQRIVLGVHGLGGSADDDIQTAIAEEMGFFSSATFRFDFPGHGESPLDSEDFTLDICRASLLAVAREARQRYPEVEDLCIFATGFGAYVTLLSLEGLLEIAEDIRLVVQTPSVRMHETLLTMLGLSEQTLRAMDRYVIPLPRPLTIYYNLYKQMKANIALTTHPIPMLILQGQEDKYIRMDDIRQFHRINEGSKLVIIPGAGHRFLEEGAWDMVLDLTRDWFEFEQVLLSDCF